MKPLIIIEYDGFDYEPERAQQIDEFLSKQTTIQENYDILVLWGGHAKIYNIPFFVKLYYKLKSWILKKRIGFHLHKL